MEKDFTGIDYLAQGTPRQRHCHRVLSSLRLFERLEAYGPVLAGTFPIGLDVPGSDLDIVCQVEDFEAFRRLLECHFGSREGFEVDYRARCTLHPKTRVAGMRSATCKSKRGSWLSLARSSAGRSSAGKSGG